MILVGALKPLFLVHNVALTLEAEVQCHDVA
jgi:hypothetical protein